MDRLTLEESESRFVAFVESLNEVIGHRDRIGPFRDYCAGLLAGCERKSVEPLAAITAPSRVSAQHQSLLHFVGKACWSDEAVVEEHVPASHTTVGYFLRGAYRKANANAIRTSQSRASSLMQVGGGLLLSTKGIYLLLASMTRGKVETVKALQRIWSGAGTMAGALVQRGGQLQTNQSA